MSIVAVVPIKMNNERLPGKNTKLLGSKPLISYCLETLLAVASFGAIYVYCSNEEIKPYLPTGVQFLKRPENLDLPTANFNQIFDNFLAKVEADIYVYAHATAPFMRMESIKKCLNAVIIEEYDSAFFAQRIQDYLWQNGNPLNFDAENLCRSQDLPIIYRETSGAYVIRREVYQALHRRVGRCPYIHEVSFREAIDINDSGDFRLAELFLGERG